ncbi:MAG: PD40 domain-containing protein [Burkholderiales bacterium]|nr:PD40 domain-containing protein [Anaerolineae bacterium]
MRAGIEAARVGDNTKAQDLLKRVVIADENNELAWLWLASTADTIPKRRACLERVLQINPNNERALEAMRRLDVADGSGSRPSRSDARSRSEEEQNRQAVEQLRRIRQTREQKVVGRPTPRIAVPGGFPVLIGVMILFVIVLIVFGAVALQQVAVSPTPQNIVLQPRDTETPIPGTATVTPFTGILVTVDNPTLPPTFTPTGTQTPSDTPTPTETPFPMAEFQLLTSGVENGAAQPALFSMLGDGSDEALVAEDALGFYEVAYSPDGSQIAFTRPHLNDAPPVVEEPTIAVEATEEEEPSVVEAESTQQVFGAPTVEPEVVEEVVEEPASPYRGAELFVAPADSPEDAVQISFSSGETVSHPTWSPDGTHLAIVSDSAGDTEIYTIQPDGGDGRQLTDNNLTDKDPAWGTIIDANGDSSELIAFASDRDGVGSTEIYTMTPDGGNVIRLTDDTGSSYAPAWSPDGSHIVYVSDRSGDGDIYIMEANGEGKFLLTIDDDGAEDRSPIFSPDGQRVFFISNREDDEFQVYSVSLNGEDVIRVTDNGSAFVSLDFLPASDDILNNN